MDWKTSSWYDARVGYQAADLDTRIVGTLHPADSVRRDGDTGGDGLRWIAQNFV